MKLVFVYWGYEDAGSMLDLRGYLRAARTLGHEVILYGPAQERADADGAVWFQGAYGPPRDRVALNYTQDLRGVDAAVFVFEWTTRLREGDRLDWARLLAAVPRRRRVVIDCDGGYNDPIRFEEDFNHPVPFMKDRNDGGLESSRRWVEWCDSLSDKVCQPTLRPRRPNVRPFLFHIYDPAWERPFDFSAKEFSLVYVGHTKWRWRPMLQLLDALKPAQDRLGRIVLIGDGWGAIPDWANKANDREKYFTDPDYLRRLGVETAPAVPFRDVIASMSRGVINPVLYRPLFEHLELVTCRTFETVAAGTIPLFCLPEDYVRKLYGDRAGELVLSRTKPVEQVLDMLSRPDHYADIVCGIRQEFARRHSPEARLRELLQIVEC